MVALEYVKEDKMSFKILETIAEFMHQISSVFDLRKSMKMQCNTIKRQGF